MKIVVDSYAWIEIFAGTNEGRRAKEAIKAAEYVYTPDIVLAEIARKYIREDIDQRSIRERLVTIENTSTVIPIDEEIAVETAKSFLELRKFSQKYKLSDPSLFDAIVLGVARNLQGKVLTGDPHFKYLTETIWLGM